MCYYLYNIYIYIYIYGNGNNNTQIVQTWPLKVKGKEEDQHQDGGRSREKPTEMDCMILSRALILLSAVTVGSHGSPADVTEYTDFLTLCMS